MSKVLCDDQRLVSPDGFCIAVIVCCCLRVQRYCIGSLFLKATVFKARPWKLGLIGRPGASQLHSDLHRFIPVITSLVASGKLVPNEYEVVGKTGVAAGIEAFGRKQGGASKKIVVRIQEP